MIVVAIVSKFHPWAANFVAAELSVSGDIGILNITRTNDKHRRDLPCKLTARAMAMIVIKLRYRACGFPTMGLAKVLNPRPGSVAD